MPRWDTDGEILHNNKVSASGKRYQMLTLMEHLESKSCRCYATVSGDYSATSVWLLFQAYVDLYSSNFVESLSVFKLYILLFYPYNCFNFYFHYYLNIYLFMLRAPPWSSGSVLDHRSLPPVFESRRGHIWRLFRLSLSLIAFGSRSAHLAYRVHKSGRKTSIIISQSLLVYFSIFRCLRFRESR